MTKPNNIQVILHLFEIKKRTTDKDFESKYKDKIKYYILG